MCRQTLLLLALCGLLSANTAAGADKFRAHLSGNQEVPPVKSMAKGEVHLLLSDDGKGMSYRLVVQDLYNPTGAHIHKGKRGENGPPVAGLFGAPAPTPLGKVRGLLAQGILTDQSLIGELQGKRLKDLVELLKAGKAYVNVHTEAFPDGEIRGQIK